MSGFTASEAMAPTCSSRCPTKGGTCFPDPCKLYVERRAHAATSQGQMAAARWRVQQCRQTVKEGERELRLRKAALVQAEAALAGLEGA